MPKRNVSWRRLKLQSKLERISGVSWRVIFFSRCVPADRGSRQFEKQESELKFFCTFKSDMSIHLVTSTISTIFYSEHGFVHKLFIFAVLSPEQFLFTVSFKTVRKRLRNATECNEMQFNAMKCNSTQWNAMKCNSIQWNAIQCNEMQFNAMKCNSVQWNAIQCNEM